MSATDVHPSLSDELNIFMGQKGFEVPAIEFNTESWARATINGKNRGSAKFYLGQTRDGKPYLKALLYDFASNKCHHFLSTGNYSKEELAEIERSFAEAEKGRVEDEKRKWEHTAASVNAKFSMADEVGFTPYLEKKGFQKSDGAFGARFETPNYGGELNILVPLRDIDGKLWTVQRIRADGEKQYESGGKKSGNFHTIGEIVDGNIVYLCEGFATGASIYKAVGPSPVICAMDTGNLPLVARALRDKYPKSPICICADNDQFGPDGKNPGLEAAKKAMSGIPNCLYAVPEFKNLDTKPTDFNDLMILEGLERLHTILFDALPAPTDSSDNDAKSHSFLPPYHDDADSPPRQATEVIPAPKGKKKAKEPKVPKEPKPAKDKPNEFQIAVELRDRYEGNIIRQKDSEDELFTYTGTHWKRFSVTDKAQIINELVAMSWGVWGSKAAKAAFEMFKYQLPEAPRNMDVGNPYLANFSNGTLEITTDIIDGKPKFGTNFREHRRNDYLTHTNPIAFKPDSTRCNERLQKQFELVFRNDPDKEEKIRAVRQMYGALLFPVFPRLFLFYGPGGTGKSSLIIPAIKLLPPGSYSAIEPHLFDKFAMEPMVGKLANISLDIKTTMPIEDANIKKIEDRMEVSIDRKNKTHIMAPLPAVHVFGANGVPRTLDGGSGAHARRWSFIECKHDITTSGTEYDRDYGQQIYNSDPEGILAFAYQGLLDLLESGGKYSQPSSGKARMKEWQLEGDLVGTFLDDVARNELASTTLKISDEQKIRASELWEIFKTWCEDSHPGQLRYMRKNNLYKRLAEKNFPLRQGHARTSYIHGIGKITAKEGAAF